MRRQVFLVSWVAVLCFACAEDSRSTDTTDTDVMVPESMDMTASVGDMGGPDATAVLDTDLGDPIPDAAITRPDPTYGLSTQSVDVDGVTREYLLYVPEAYDGSTSVPVMMNFHGGGMNAQAQMFLADMRPLADAENFILIYPEGTLLDTGDPHWNPLVSSENNKSDADDFGFIAAMLDRLEGEYAIDSQRVYATGYSNGAGFAYGLACYLSDRITAVAPISGSMYEEMVRDCPATHPTAIMIMNGTQDFERPYEGFPGYFVTVDQAVSFWADYNQISNPPTESAVSQNGLNIEHALYEGGTNGASVSHFKVNNGGHDWFDFTIEGANINALIWNFLSQFDQNGLR